MRVLVVLALVLAVAARFAAAAPHTVEALTATMYGAGTHHVNAAVPAPLQARMGGAANLQFDAEGARAWYWQGLTLANCPHADHLTARQFGMPSDNTVHTFHTTFYERDAAGLEYELHVYYHHNPAAGGSNGGAAPVRGDVIVKRYNCARGRNGRRVADQARFPHLAHYLTLSDNLAAAYVTAMHAGTGAWVETGASLSLDRLKQRVLASTSVAVGKEQSKAKDAEAGKKTVALEDAALAEAAKLMPNFAADKTKKHQVETAMVEAFMAGSTPIEEKEDGPGISAEEAGKMFFAGSPAGAEKVVEFVTKHITSFAKGTK